jgi:hypothetical protein
MSKLQLVGDGKLAAAELSELGYGLVKLCSFIHQTKMPF